MKKYKVFLDRAVRVMVEVDAENEEQARNEVMHGKYDTWEELMTLDEDVYAVEELV